MGKNIIYTLVVKQIITIKKEHVLKSPVLEETGFLFLEPI